MGNHVKMTIGILIALLIFCLSMIAGKCFIIPVGFIPKTFITHTVMILLSVPLIYYYKIKGILSIKNDAFKFGNALKSIGITILSIFVVNILSTVVIAVIYKSFLKEVHPGLINMKPVQVILFVFIYASFAEEMLYRVFLQNYIYQYFKTKIYILKLTVSVSVLISGFLFGASHFILLFSGSSLPFVLRIVVFATTLGLLAGYFQEKHKNILYAFIVHMTGNIPAIIASFLLK